MNAKVLTIMLALLIFVGQSLVAAVIPCPMENMDMSSTEMSHDMTHDQDTMSDCGVDCNCPMATCLSVIVTDPLTIKSLTIITEKITSPDILASNKSSTFLYRPPITR